MALVALYFFITCSAFGIRKEICKSNNTIIVLLEKKNRWMNSITEHIYIKAETQKLTFKLVKT